MKTKKAIIRILMSILMVILVIGITSSLAVQGETKELQIQYKRRIYNKDTKSWEDTKAYALNKAGALNKSHFPVYQILDEKGGINYFCLNANVGDTWQSSSLSRRYNSNI